jgi:hypothetical protein
LVTTIVLYVRWREDRQENESKGEIECYNAMDLGTAIGWDGADGTLSDCDTIPGILILLGGVLPGFELVRYTMPVPVRGIGFEKPGVVGVVGAVELPDGMGPGRVGPEAVRMRCRS